jgi:amino acid adenylation domain-containing protein
MRAERVAALLRREGVGPEGLVGLYFQRSIQAAVSVLSVLKAGGAYVPLDPDYPPQRIDSMVEDTNLSVILTDSIGFRRFGNTHAVPRNLKVIPVDSCTEVGPREHSREDTTSNVTQGNAAFVIFTSGSTGRPKATVVTHASLSSRLADCPLPDIQAGDTCCWSSSLNFGISSSRLLLPLALGASVVVLNDGQARDVRQFAQAVATYQITSAFAVPAFLRQLLLVSEEGLAQLSSLRAVASGGGMFTTDLFNELHKRFPNVQFINLYGSTEIGTTATLKVLKDGEAVSIGLPVQNTRIYILDSKLNPVEKGTVGELYVGSPHLARGYLHRPDLTKERFIQNPFVRGERLCRTGDLARFLSYPTERSNSLDVVTIKLRFGAFESN